MTDPYTQEQQIMDAMTKKMVSVRNVARNAARIVRTQRRKNPDRAAYKKLMKRCKYCGATEDLTVDHKIPLIRGGADNAKNWQCLCKECNTTKSSMTDKEVKNLFQWVLRVQKRREDNGRKPLKLSIKEHAVQEPKKDT